MIYFVKRTRFALAATVALLVAACGAAPTPAPIVGHSVAPHRFGAAAPTNWNGGPCAIDTTQPQPGNGSAPAPSAPIRANFYCIVQDLAAAVSELSGPALPSPALAGQRAILTSTAPWQEYIYTGATWIEIATIDPTGLSYTPLLSPAQIEAALGYTPLNPANNLSELIASAATARANLGVGAAGTKGIGTCLADPGTGNLDFDPAYAGTASLTANAKAFAAADTCKYWLMNNAGVAMTATLPPGSGTARPIAIFNTDATASVTFTVTGGGWIGTVGQTSWALNAGKRTWLWPDGAGDWLWLANDNALAPLASPPLTGTPTVNAVPFGTAAFDNTGTSGATIPLNNANNTLSGNNTASGTLNVTGTFQAGGNTQTLPGVAATLTYKTGAYTSGHCLQASGTAGLIADAGANCATVATYASYASPSALSPSGPASTSTFTMQGLAGSITPSATGKVLIVITGRHNNNSLTAVTDGILGRISYGTGIAPTNGAALTGTQVGTIDEVTNPTTVSANSYVSNFSLAYLVTGLTPSTPYWIDLAAQANAAVGFTYQQVFVNAAELP